MSTSRAQPDGEQHETTGRPQCWPATDRRREFRAHLRYLERRMARFEAITAEDTQEVRLLFQEQWSMIHAAFATAQQRLQALQRGAAKGPYRAGA